MKRIKLVLAILMISSFAFGQNREEADKLVDEGIIDHDKGEFVAAIAKYDKALILDKDNLFALAEKAMTLMSLKKYDEVISNCKKAIKKHPKDKDLKNVYVSYGNALDGLKEPKKSIQIYDEGIKNFPEYYHLYYNKGVTLAGSQKYEEALLCFEKSVSLNPKHASSHNGVAQLIYAKKAKMPALMAFCRFLVQEPQGKRAEVNLDILQKILKADVKKTGENNITLSIAMPEKGKKAKENDFAMTEMMLGLASALDYDDENKNETEIMQFIRKIDIICGSLGEGKKEGKGFYWENYAPYFIELKEKKLTQTFAYIVFASSEKPEIKEWLDTHKTEIDAFYAWNKAFVGTKK